MDKTEKKIENKSCNKTQDELKEIAKDLYAGQIFTDRHIKDSKMLPSVFMAINFLNKKQLNALEADCGLIYEYMNKANPGSVNGMPTFFSMRLLTKNETKEMFEYYEQVKEAMEKI